MPELLQGLPFQPAIRFYLDQEPMFPQNSNKACKKIGVHKTRKLRYYLKGKIYGVAETRHICAQYKISLLAMLTSRRTVCGFSLSPLMSCSIFWTASATSQLVKRGFSTASESTSSASGMLLFTTSMLYAICEPDAREQRSVLLAVCACDRTA